MKKIRFSDKDQISEQIQKLADDPERLKLYLDQVIPFAIGPHIDDFSPQKGYPGAILEIKGKNFVPTRDQNHVKIGGKPALVIEANSNSLKVISHPETISGKLEVGVGNKIVVGPFDFETIPCPKPYSRIDGPPIFFSGNGQGLPGDVPSTGTLNVLVVLVNPTDRVPANATASRNSVVQNWNDVHTFYEQASYGRLDVQADITTNWHTLTGNFNDFVDLGIQNIRPNQLNRLMAEAAQAAVDEGFNLDDYAVMACVINLNNSFIRAWGGWDAQNFLYNDGAGTNINITTSHPINLLAIQESADWGRFAHELGHNIVSAPSALSASPGAATLGEDVYSSDLVDPSVATAQSFDMMGNHDSHPLFSAYYMEKLGWYNSSNILNLQWDRNPYSQEFEVVAHGSTENSLGARYHLIKIHVANGLCYFIEVRQRPDSDPQIYDENIPVNGAPQEGGVVVTKVFTDVVMNNQQMRFVTLMHDVKVLKQGDVSVDPARALKLTVVNDQVVNRPLVCRVRVEWAQSIADDPSGAFDLRIDPWDGSYQTPDIWIDRIPFGSFDNTLDAEGRPHGNGDKPRPGEINQFWARVHCDGAVGATNARVTFYSITPPGVGDNGNWSPIQTKTIPSINADGHADVSVNWVPVIGQHTCMKVAVEQQLGEITGGNNLAQENIFDFEAPASSVPKPVVISVAVRNPLKDCTIALLSVSGVPEGFKAYFPHAWIWLDPLEERRLDLVVIPILDFQHYQEHCKERGEEKRAARKANVKLTGYIPRSYQDKVPPGTLPGSRMLAIGGIMAQVTPKRRIEIWLKQDPERSTGNSIAVMGSIKPAMTKERLRVDLIEPSGSPYALEASTDDQGRFFAIFSLIKPINGVYRAQAFTINSPNAAQAESNVVYIRKFQLAS